MLFIPCYIDISWSVSVCFNICRCNLFLICLRAKYTTMNSNKLTCYGVSVVTGCGSTLGAQP